MSKKVVLVLAVLAAVILIAACATTSSVPIKEKKTIIMSGHADWWPVMKWDKVNNTISGIGPNAARMVFNGMGIEVDSQYVGSWETVQQKLKTGEIDGVCAIYKTREREEYLYYSIPYTTDPIALYIKKGKGFTYRQKEDLIGKSGVATVGDSYGQEFDDFIIQSNLSMVRVATPQQAFALLNEEKVDYFIYSAYAGRKVLSEENLSGFEEAAIVSDQLFYMGISKKSPYAKYMGEINASLEKLIAEGKIPKS